VSLTEHERALFARWVRLHGAARAAWALGEDAHTVLSVAVGCARGTTERRIAEAWRAWLGLYGLEGVGGAAPSP
jgi:hypothetical protein